MFTEPNFSEKFREDVRDKLNTYQTPNAIDTVMFTVMIEFQLRKKDLDIAHDIGIITQAEYDAALKGIINVSRDFLGMVHI